MATNFVDNSIVDTDPNFIRMDQQGAIAEPRRPQQQPAPQTVARFSGLPEDKPAAAQLQTPDVPGAVAIVDPMAKPQQAMAPKDIKQVQAINYQRVQEEFEKRRVAQAEANQRNNVRAQRSKAILGVVGQTDRMQYRDRVRVLERVRRVAEAFADTALPSDMLAAKRTGRPVQPAFDPKRLQNVSGADLKDYFSMASAKTQTADGKTFKAQVAKEQQVFESQLNDKLTKLQTDLTTKPPETAKEFVERTNAVLDIPAEREYAANAVASMFPKHLAMAAGAKAQARAIRDANEELIRDNNREGFVAWRMQEFGETKEVAESKLSNVHSPEMKEWMAERTPVGSLIIGDGGTAVVKTAAKMTKEERDERQRMMELAAFAAGAATGDPLPGDESASASLLKLPPAQEGEAPAAVSAQPGAFADAADRLVAAIRDLPPAELEGAIKEEVDNLMAVEGVQGDFAALRNEVVKEAQAKVRENNKKLYAEQNIARAGEIGKLDNIVGSSMRMPGGAFTDADVTMFLTQAGDSMDDAAVAASLVLNKYEESMSPAVKAIVSTQLARMVAGKAGEDTLGAPNIAAAFNVAKSAVTNLRANNQRAADKEKADMTGRLSGYYGVPIDPNILQDPRMSTVRVPGGEAVITADLKPIMPDNEQNPNAERMRGLLYQAGLAQPNGSGLMFGFPTVPEDSANRARLAMQGLSAGLSILPSATNADVAGRVRDLIYGDGWFGSGFDATAKDAFATASISDFLIGDFKDVAFGGRKELENMMRSGDYSKEQIAATANTLAYNAQLSAAHTTVEKAINEGGFQALEDYYLASTGKAWVRDEGKPPSQQMFLMSQEIADASKRSGFDSSDPAVRLAQDDAIDALGLRSFLRGGNVYVAGLLQAKKQYGDLGRSNEAQMLETIRDNLGAGVSGADVVRMGVAAAKGAAATNPFLAIPAAQAMAYIESWRQ